MWPGDGVLLATCGGGAEEFLAAEIERLFEVSPSVGKGIVEFQGRAAETIRANRELRTASRVLVRVGKGHVSTYDQLYRLVARLPWDRWIPPHLTLAVNATCRDRNLSDYRAVALKTKDAIVDAQRRSGPRSNVDRKSPDVPVAVHVENGTATVSLDSSGRPLHERGYRREAGTAPMRETVAAALVLASGWDGTGVFLDPFCGSGTIAIEAALLARNRKPWELGRRYAFENWEWLDTKKIGSQSLRDQSQPRAEGSARIIARDIDREMVRIARANASRAGVEEEISFETADFFEANAPEQTGVLIGNPPYGERLEITEAEHFYRSLGSRLKSSYVGWRAFLLSANREAAKRIGLRPTSRKQIWHGGLDARLYELDIYGGGSE